MSWTASLLVHAGVLGVMFVTVPRVFHLVQVQSGTASIELVASMQAEPEPVEVPPPTLMPEIDPQPATEHPAATPEREAALPELALAEIPVPPTRDVPPPKLPQRRSAAPPDAQPIVMKPRPPEPRPTDVAKLATVVPAVATPASRLETGANVDELPQKLPMNPAPAYPPDAYARGIQGSVVIRATVATSGNVSDARVETSSGYASLDSAALSAVLRWRYSPATRGGLAIEFDVLQPIRFSIRRG